MKVNLENSDTNIVVMDCSKEELLRMYGPVFGHTVVDQASAIIYMRADLPRSVYQSVLVHERVHVKQKVPTSFWHDEPPAWWAGFKASPSGFFLGIVMSLAPSRLWFYVKRLLSNS